MGCNFKGLTPYMGGELGLPRGILAFSQILVV